MSARCSIKTRRDAAQADSGPEMGPQGLPLEPQMAEDVAGAGPGR